MKSKNSWLKFLASVLIILNIFSTVYADKILGYSPPIAGGCPSSTMVGAASAQECSVRCSQTGGCQGFTFIAGNTTPNCFIANSACSPTGVGMFYVKFNDSLNVNSVTGEQQQFIGMTARDCEGYDINSSAIQGVDAIGCGRQCTMDAECRGFSISSNRCYLKKQMQMCNYTTSNGFSYYEKYGSPTGGNNNFAQDPCPVGNPNCEQQLRYGNLPGSNQNQAVLYPRVNRAGKTIAATDASDAILGQTSYLARVMLQANDVYPPSHVSSRVSGENYLSSVIPTKYNNKALAEATLRRSFLGADSFSGAPNTQTVVRDWVEYHMVHYCDPLAAKLNLHGCVYPPVTASDIANGKITGVTPWEAKSAFAADVTATSLMQSKITNNEAAMRYVYNLTNILPSPITMNQQDFSIPEKYINPDYKGLKVLKDNGYGVYMGYLARQSKLSLAQYAVTQLFAERMELANLKIPVTRWNDAGKKSVTFEPTSRQGLLEFEANKRFSDPEWYDRVQQMPTPALMKEMAYMQALQLTLEFKRYEQQQIQTALFASLASDISAMLQMALDMKNQDPADTKDQLNNSLKSLGINIPGKP